MQNLKENWFAVSKMARICWILTWALQILKIPLWFFPLICSFSYITFDLKKYMGVIFRDTEEWCKIWRKTDLKFRKWHEEYGKFSPEHLKVSKLGIWRDPLIQSRKCMRAKFTEESCVMTMKNNAKFQEELTCCFEIDMKNLKNFDLSTRKPRKFSFYWVPFEQSIYCWS